MTTAVAAERYLKIRSGLSMRDRDPLAYWTHSSDQSREASRLLSLDVDELYARAANKAGKTEWAAAFVLACLQKRKTLDGVPIPQWRGPVAGLALALDYNQQKLSVQQTILRLLGKWPHHAKWKGDDILSSIRIMPVGGDPENEADWSTLTFMSQENKRSGVGARADIVWADEPPVEEIWREVRKAAHAGRRMVRLISATPTLRRQWAWLKEEYGDGPRGRANRVNQDMAEVRWSLYDNRALSPPEVQKLLRMYAKDPLERGDKKARSHGDYVDASGSCPFDIPTLLQMLEDPDFCLEPIDEIEWPIQFESDESGQPHESRLWPVKFFGKPKPGASVRCTIDPSAGIDDSKHDPFYAEWCEIGSGDVLAECEGYLPGKLVGILCAGISRRFMNNALVDFECNDRWGVNVLDGLQAAGYGNIAREPRELQGKLSLEPGFHNNANSRPIIIGSVQSQIEAYRAGVRYGRMPRATIECLLDCILDEAGKIVAAPGLHDERLICRGQALRTAVTIRHSRVPETQEQPKSAKAKLISRMRGENEWEEAPGHQVALVPRRRPR